MSKVTKRHLAVFLLFGLWLYWFIDTGSGLVRFNASNYYFAAKRFLNDPRFEGKAATLTQKLAVWDAQWYLKVAADGYPKNPTLPPPGETANMGGAVYAFYPLFPGLVALGRLGVGDLLTAALMVNSLLLVAAWVSLVVVAGKMTNAATGIKAAWLLFLWPASVFLRSYYGESLALLLSVWFGYWLYKKKLLAAAVMAGLMNLTKGRLYMLNLVWLAAAGWWLKKKEVTGKEVAGGLVIIGGLGAGWLLFNLMQTGDAFYFARLVSYWYNVPPWMSLVYNLDLALKFFGLPLHGVHYSKIEVATMIVTGWLVIKSRRILPKWMWAVGAAIFIGPLVVRDLTSFTRYQAINWPIFVYLAGKLPTWAFKLMLTVEVLALAGTALALFNWYWVG